MKKLLSLLMIFIVVGVIFPNIAGAFSGFYPACNSELDDQGDCNGQIITVCHNGLVPCGKEVNVGSPSSAPLNTNGYCEGGYLKVVPCQFCHFFILTRTIVNFVFTKLVPLMTVLFLVIGGIAFYFSGGSPSKVAKAKKIIIGVIIGVILVYSSYMIVGLILNVLGASQFNHFGDWATKGAYTINCTVVIP